MDQFGIKYVFSNFNLLDVISSRFFVDIGASDGITESNSYWLAKEEKFDGVSMECDPKKFPKLCKNQPSNIVKVSQRVYPNNIVDILRTNNCPKEFGLLSLDIDSYDYFVLDSILQHYSPEILCCEINEKIPPPIRFTVNFIDEKQWWDVSHLYGASIQMFDDFRKYGYQMFYLDYYNVYLSKSPKLNYKNVDEIYAEGYGNKMDRIKRLPWNKDCEIWQVMNPEDALQSIKERFCGQIASGLASVSL